MNKGRNKGRKSKKLATDYQGSGFGTGVKREAHVHGPWGVKNGRDCCLTCPYVGKRVPSMTFLQTHTDPDRSPVLLPKRKPGALLGLFEPPFPVAGQPVVVDVVRALNANLDTVPNLDPGILQKVKDGIENIPDDATAEPVFVVTEEHVEDGVRVIDRANIVSLDLVASSPVPDSAPAVVVPDPEKDKAGFIRFMCTDPRDGIWIALDSNMRKQELWDRVYELISRTDLKFKLLKKTTRGELITYIQSLKQEWEAGR